MHCLTDVSTRLNPHLSEQRKGKKKRKKKEKGGVVCCNKTTMTSVLFFIKGFLERVIKD